MVLTFDEKNVLMAGWNAIFVLDISDERNFKLKNLTTRAPVMRDDIWPTIIRIGDGSKIEKLVIGDDERNSPTERRTTHGIAALASAYVDLDLDIE